MDHRSGLFLALFLALLLAALSAAFALDLPYQLAAWWRRWRGRREVPPGVHIQLQGKRESPLVGRAPWAGRE